MNKHLHNSLRALFLSLAVLMSLPMLAVEVMIDGINYDLNAETKQATVVEKSSGKYFDKVVIPESVEHEGTAYIVTSIGEYAFYDCYGLTSVTISNSVTSIGESAFEDCSGLTSVTIPNSVRSIRERAFSKCSGLTSVTIGNSVTSIGKEAFIGCSGLTSVTISDIAAWCNIDFDNLLSNPLYYARHLYLNGEEVKDLVIPNSVTSIGEWAFYECSRLTSVTIPNNVKSIGDDAFYNCSRLTSVTIGNGVTWIGDNAFANCPELLDVYCYAENVPSADSYAFYGSYPEYITLHVPDASIYSYKTTSPWSGFGKIVALTDEETGIDELKGENGKECSAVYDLSGRRVQKAQKGIYIQNGKVMVQ